MSEPEALTDVEVATSVRQLVTGNHIAWTKHAEERMAERGIDKSEVKECLSRGTFAERPVIPNRYGPVEYKFTMQATVDSETLYVAASLVPHSKVVVITLY